MKQFLVTMFLTFPVIGFCQIALPEIKGEEDWEKVIITRNPDDIKSLTRVITVKGEAMKLYGKQSKLRAKATEQVKREAAKKGASIVLINLDNFEMTPLNNVQMEGTAYKKIGANQNDSTTEIIKSQIELPEISGEEDWEKVIITRNPSDIKGLTRITTVKGEAMKLYGKQSKLRAKATEQVKREAAKKGASIVLVNLDNFEMTPLNNVQMEGTAYKK